MPGFNGTGPMGMGPRTGGGFGFCAPGVGPVFPGSGGYGYPRGAGRGFAPWGGGRGRVFGGGGGGGRGRGRGWFGQGIGPGWSGGYYPGMPSGYGASPADEKAFLEAQLGSLERELEEIRSRIGELEKKPEE